MPPTGIDAEIAPHAPKSLERLIAIGGADYEALFSGRSDRARAARGRRSRLAVLHLGHDRTAEGRHAHASTIWWRRAIAYGSEVDPVTPGDAILHAAPMSHGSGVYIMQHVARLGVQVMPESGGFEPEEIVALFNAWPRLSMFAAPTMIKRLVACPAELQRREHPHADLGRRADVCRGRAGRARPLRAAAGADLRPGRGADDHHHAVESRTSPTATHPRWRERLGSAGKPYACVEVMVADAQDKPVAQGEAGEILCRGVIMAGYWQNPEASAASLRGGWLHTGDVGVFDAEGYLHLKDRSKDLIISGGSNIYPREVEEVLLTHAKVREVSVIGRPDREWGEAVVAYVVGEASAGRTRRAVPFPHCALQAAEGLCFCRRAAEEQLRQDPEDGAARHGCEEGRPDDERNRRKTCRRALPALRQGDRSGVQAVLLQALRRHRSQPLALRRLCGAGERGRRRGRRAAGRTRRRRAIMNVQAAEWPDRLFATLKRAGIRQVGYVPDAGHSRLIERCRADADIRDVVLTTEEEGVALAAGAWLGGERAALLMQSSGLGNCVNMFSLARSCRFPLLMLITMRGEWEEFNPWQVPMGSIVDPVLKLCEARSLSRDQAGRGRRRGRARRAARVRRRAHRRRDAVAATDRQEGVDQMSETTGTPRRHGHAARRSRRRSAGRARSRLDHLGSGRRRRRRRAISICGAPWAAPP